MSELGRQCLLEGPHEAAMTLKHEEQIAASDPRGGREGPPRSVSADDTRCTDVQKEERSLRPDDGNPFPKPRLAKRRAWDSNPQPASRHLISSQAANQFAYPPKCLRNTILRLVRLPVKWA